ncbi:hypothetical protein Tco_0340205 [Tanacetum coccineum]
MAFNFGLGHSREMEGHDLLGIALTQVTQLSFVCTRKHKDEEKKKAQDLVVSLFKGLCNSKNGGCQKQPLSFDFGESRTALMHSLEAARYTIKLSPAFGAIRNDSGLSALLDRNLLRAASLPFSLCISLMVLSRLRLVNAFIFAGLD